MGEFHVEDKVLLSYEGKDEVIEIPNGIEVIDERTFQGITKIKKVILPHSIKKIGKKAFFACKKLESINLSDGIELEESAFEYCENLKSISDNRSIILSKIGKNTFCWCEKLETKIVISSCVKKIPQWAFGFCKKLKYVQLPEKISLDNNAFSCCTKLESISNSGKIFLSNIDESAFSQCKNLKRVNMPESVRYGKHTFLGCTKLTKECLQKKDYVQKDKADKKETKKINIVNEVSVFVIKDSILEKYNGKLSVVHVPEEVTEIGEKAFAWNENIVSVYFKGKIKKIGKSAFLQCENLKNINLTHNIIIEEHAFENCFSLEKISNEQKYVLGETGEGAFSFCENLSNDIEIAEGSEEVKDSTFAGCLNIKKIYIPDSLKKIGQYCFGDVEEFTCENNAEMYILLKD